MRKPFWSTQWISNVHRIIIGPLAKIPDGRTYRNITFINASGEIVLPVHGIGDDGKIVVQCDDMEAKGALWCVERALEDAQSCLRGETPEIGSHDEAAADTLDLVRAALLKHLPEIKKALAK